MSSDGNFSEKYYLCDGLRSFYDYAVPKLRDAMALSSAGNAPQKIMEILTAKEREKYKKISRNDLCLCGSGLKFKQCCAKRVP